MGLVRNWTAATLAVALLAIGSGTGAQTVADEGLLVVYGPQAPSREGDTDRREQVFFSVPADLSDRIYVRVFDPETGGDGDFTYGGPADSETTFRLFGGDGAYSEADRPEPVADGAREPRLVPYDPVTQPGKLIREQVWGSDRSTDGRWVSLAAVRARQGEIVGDRAYFRIDVQGSRGNDGNGYSLGVSLARDRDRVPEGLEMFSYRPTVRWSAGKPATRVGFTKTAPGPLTVQSFDGANGQLALITDYRDLGLRISGQDFWTSDEVTTDETNLAISLLGGFETPNDVTLAVFDAEGNPLPLSMPPYRAVVPPRPVARGTGQPLADCRSVAFDASGSTGRTPLSYLWEFGDGNRSTDPVVAHRYSEPGRYTARLSLLEPGSRPGRGDRIEVPVHVRNAPAAVPGSDIVVAPGQVVEFDGSASQPSDSPITGYRWTFGDGGAAQGPRAQHVYDQPGQYRAVLRVQDDAVHPCNFGTAVRRVVVNFAPVAEAGTDQSAIVGQAVTLSGAASYDVDGAILDYRWSMGDGTVLSGETVTHRYEQSGSYQVLLTVTDDSGVVNKIATDGARIEVNAPPEPRFTIPERPVSVSEVAVLDASASTDADGQILSYIWDFGDGAMGEGPVASYAWTRAGEFSVTLTVEDDSGTASALQSITRIVRVDAAPVADAGPDQYVTATEVRFDGGGSVDPDGRVTDWQWDFGDGATASGQSVSHAYLRPGRYEVALTVRDDSGAPLNTDRDTMWLTINTAPIADAGPPQVVAPGEEFLLSGGASVDPDGAISDYLWTFPDGQVKQGQRVSHVLDEPGLHRIRLTVADNFAGGAAEDEAEVLITVNAAPVAVAGRDLLIAPGDTVVFDAGQSFDPDGRLTSYRWEFEDLGAPLEALRVERAFDAPGVWSAQLVVADDSGVLNATAADDVTIRVNHPPVAEAGAPVITDQLHVTFDGSGSKDGDGDPLIHRWDFGDGSPPVYGETVTHVFPRAGIFPVTLRVDDGTGLSNARAIDATAVTIQARPVADAGGNRDVCSGEPILFDASASADPDGGLLAYEWDFGDGSGSDLINPTKTYELPGVYPVTLKVRNGTGTEHGTAVDRIAALVREGPIADAGPDMTVCSNAQVRFDGSGSTDADGAVNAFAWTFGDGGSGSGATPQHIFRTPGTYSVTLTITGDARGACSPLDTDVSEVTVIAAPELKVLGQGRAAAGMPASFSAGLDKLGGATPEGFNWSISDGSTYEGRDIEHVFAEPGDYLVTLRSRLSGGTEACSELEVQRRIIVNAAPEPVIDAPLRVSVGQSVRFDAGGSSDSDGAIARFAWAFGDGGGAEGVQAVHRYETPGSYEVSLTVTDDAGVANSQITRSQQIEVAPSPVAGLTARGAVCPGVNLPWAVTPGGETAVGWEFGDGTVAEGAETEHGFDRPGLMPVRVLLDDGRDLPGSRRTEEIYVRVNAQPTALAGPDQVVCPGEVVVFDAGGSGDVDGDLTSWRWTFSDGVTLEGARVERVFDAAADLTVQLSVQDDSGAEGCDIGTDSARILVNGTPQVDAGPDLTVPVGGAHDVVRFDAGAASDPDGHGLRLSWSFGDGTEATGAVTRHRFANPGSYTVTVRAQDSTGLVCGIGRDTATVTAVARE
ncbi:PKD domain-containing protein [Ruegeria pomeroyi]|uniref:PKD domain-containing protein n=1 Tax=Ruegeria pomeroyi TaxID=89184 RepID=A0A9Q3ZSA1_9RHOB|nr:PKD domain-containing protein [Ruegeria pomeroyi]MCE8539777.1 PKD domain-containing protein [Ruegeria pomeroyi]